MNNKIDTKKQIVYAVHVGDYVYIGSGKHERLSGNISKVKRGKHDNKQLQEAYNNTLDVKLEILESNIETEEEARDLENDYVTYYKRIEDVIVCNKYKAVTMKKQYKRVLNEEKVIEIKMLLAEGKMKNKEIAIIYGVTDSVISKIKTGLRWSSVAI